MRKKYLLVVALACLILLVSACKSKSGAATGGAPRTPFLGGTSGLTINFEKDSPPPEVTDSDSFPFNVIVSLKNDGEAKIDKKNIKINLVGFDPNDFGINFDKVTNAEPTEDLDPKRRDAEGNIIDGTTTFVEFPKTVNPPFTPKKLSGNTEFTFRADVCYNYQTEANARLCILKDMLNIRDDSICTPSAVGTSSRPIYSSAAPVQVTNFRQSVIGANKISFNFDIVLSGNVDIFYDKERIKPVTTFDQGCPKEARARRERENNVWVEIKEGDKQVLRTISCGGLSDDGKTGIVRLINGRRTITCTAGLIDAKDRRDLEKIIDIVLEYNVLDNKETKVLVKHLAGGEDDKLIATPSSRQSPSI